MNKHLKKAVKIITASAVIAAAGAVYSHADDSRLSCPHYTVSSDKVKDNIRLAQISDLHGHCYGNGQSELIAMIDKYSPDAVIFTGDIFDDRVGDRDAYRLINSLKDTYRCLYVSGNHECKSGHLEETKACLRECGVEVLEGDTAVLKKGSTEIKISGVDDVCIDRFTSPGMFMSQFNKCNKESDQFSVLLSHRPELTELYRGSDFDLILSGHAHGGQWRIPGLINGLLAPNQGFFPKYAGGRYELGGSSLIVSRGLQKGTSYLPRIYNRPELVIVDICHSETA